MSVQPVNLITEAKQHGAEIAATLREMADEAEKGAVSGLVVVAQLRDKNQYWTHSHFEDKWRLLGAIEYAKGEILLR